MKEGSLKFRAGGMAFVVLSIFFAVCVLTQLYIAGMSVFVNPAWWMRHMVFVHLFGFSLPLLMLVSAFIGGLPRSILVQVLGVMLSIFLMYFTANITGTLPWAGALHPVIAVFILIQSLLMVKMAWGLMFPNRQIEGAEG
jgi:mercuric ion transport protein